MTQKRAQSFDELPIMLNANDVAGVLGISRAYAYNLFHSVGFPTLTVGKRRMVNKDSFKRWIQAQSELQGGRGNAHAQD